VEGAGDPLCFLADRTHVLEQVVEVSCNGQVLEAHDNLALRPVEGQRQRVGDDMQPVGFSLSMT
jgi:hypothetical protein